MSRLSVRLFGRLSVSRNDAALDGLTACKVQELLCYLLLHRDRTHSRETLAGLLWGDCSTPQSRKYLRQALWQLQAALSPHGEPPEARTLLVESANVRLDSAGIWLDIAVFERAFELIRGIPSDQLDAATAVALHEAAELYQGHLLEGWYQDWCLSERERLQDLYLTMLDKLMDYCVAHREYDSAIAYGGRILRHDRARECTHQRLMRLQYLAGDRGAALRQYQRCVAALSEDLGVEPSEITTALHEDIRIGRLQSKVATPVSKVASDIAAGPLVDVMSRLRQLEAALVGLQQQVQEHIGAVGELLGSPRQPPRQAANARHVATVRRAIGT